MLSVANFVGWPSQSRDSSARVRVRRERGRAAVKDSGTLARRSGPGRGSAAPGGERGKRCARRLLLLAVVGAACVGLFCCYLRLSATFPGGSDGASNALEAWDLLHGNWLLRGWTLTDVSFYTTELPEYAAVELARGLNPGVLHVAAALTYTLLVAGRRAARPGPGARQGRLGPGADRGRDHGRAAARRRRPRAARPARPRRHPGADPGHLPAARARAPPLVHAHARSGRCSPSPSSPTRSRSWTRSCRWPSPGCCTRSGRGGRPRTASSCRSPSPPGAAVTTAEPLLTLISRAGGFTLLPVQTALTTPRRRARPPAAGLARDPEPVRRRRHDGTAGPADRRWPGCTPRASPSPWPRSPSRRGTCPRSVTSSATCSPWESSSTWPGSSPASSRPRRSTPARSRRCSRSARCWPAGSSARGWPPPGPGRLPRAAARPRRARAWPGCARVRPGRSRPSRSRAPASSPRSATEPTQPAAADPEQALAGWLAAHGLTSGLGTFTEGNLTTLDSGGAVRLLTVSWLPPVPRPPGRTRASPTCEPASAPLLSAAAAARCPGCTSRRRPGTTRGPSTRTSWSAAPPTGRPT